MRSRTQIVATLGPASNTKEIIKEMAEKGMDVVRLNFSWGTHEEHATFIETVREVAHELNTTIPIIQDLSGPRIQKGQEHGFDGTAQSVITEKDKIDLAFTKEHKPEYVALSFVGSENDIQELRSLLEGCDTKIIAKIERKVAVDNIDTILDVADAIMIARGDLGNEVALEQIPFVQNDLIAKANLAGKPVIVATEMMPSMVESETPTRSDVTDVAYAVMQDADGIMLSNETAVGKNPVAVVAMMERIAIEAEQRDDDDYINPL